MSISIDSIEQFNDEEAAWLKAKDILLKSRAFLLVTVSQSNKMIGFDYLHTLNELEEVGFGDMMIDYVNARFGHSEESVEEDVEEDE